MRVRIEVPEKVFSALQAYRQRWGSMSLVDTDKIAAEFRQAGQTEEADWIDANYSDVIKGSVVGFVIEGTSLPPELPRGTDPMED